VFRALRPNISPGRPRGDSVEAPGNRAIKSRSGILATPLGLEPVSAALCRRPILTRSSRLRGRHFKAIDARALWSDHATESEDLGVQMSGPEYRLSALTEHFVSLPYPYGPLELRNKRLTLALRESRARRQQGEE
jgi:hypothetical protein